METRHLNEYVVLLNEGSFTAAARVLGISQSALSKHMAALEREFGASLVVRDARGVHASESGKVVYNLALCVDSAVARARGALLAKMPAAPDSLVSSSWSCASRADAAARVARRFALTDAERDALALYLESRNLGYVGVNLGIARDAAAELVGSVYRKTSARDCDELLGIIYSISE